jgi:hypothetical protein
MWGRVQTMSLIFSLFPFFFLHFQLFGFSIPFFHCAREDRYPEKQPHHHHDHDFASILEFPVNAYFFL